MDYRSRLSDYIQHPLLHSEELREEALEQLRLFTYSGMQLFTIFMALFFCVFVYYFVFGITVGAIAESNMTENETEPEEAIKTE